jgi:NtrC-family two-component system sensor histidine kinase KinB
MTTTRNPRDSRRACWLAGGERVFEKFFRVEHHLGGGLNGVRGTGIGLYLCREVVKAHGGSIRCEPGEGGVGTQVAFTLPADAPAA